MKPSLRSLTISGKPLRQFYTYLGRSLDDTLGLSKPWMMCDGGVLINQDRTVVGMYYSFFLNYPGDPMLISFQPVKHSKASYLTHNVAEYAALYQSIATINAYNPSMLNNLEIFADSLLVVNQVTGKWRINADHLRTWQPYCKAMVEHYNMTLRWVPGRYVKHILGH